MSQLTSLCSEQRAASPVFDLAEVKKDSLERAASEMAREGDVVEKAIVPLGV